MAMNHITRNRSIRASSTDAERFVSDIGALVIENRKKAERFEVYASHLRQRCRFLGMSELMTLNAISDAQWWIAFGLPLCESPIEEELLPWLVCEDYGAEFMTCPARVHSATELMPPDGDIFIVPQFRFGKYRMDFAVIAKSAKKGVKIVAVECDGKEFHKDRDADGRRNSYLRMFGIETVRAWGVEIKRRPRDVSFRVASLITEWAVAA